MGAVGGNHLSSPPRPCSPICRLHPWIHLTITVYLPNVLRTAYVHTKKEWCGATANESLSLCSSLFGPLLTSAQRSAVSLQNAAIQHLRYRAEVSINVLRTVPITACRPMHTIARICPVALRRRASSNKIIHTTYIHSGSMDGETNSLFPLLYTASPAFHITSIFVRK